MVATRRTVEGPLWTTMRDVKIDSATVNFTRTAAMCDPAALQIGCALISDTAFELEGRVDDVVNIGGKRASLEGLNRLLLSIDGVIDGVIFYPQAATDILA